MGFLAIPILLSLDLNETDRFYARLGFSTKGRWPGYATLRREDGLELHFSFTPDLDPKKNECACYVRFDRADEARALHDAWAKADLRGARLHPPEETDYGLLEFALVDPHGNLIRIGGRLP